MYFELSHGANDLKKSGSGNKLVALCFIPFHRMKTANIVFFIVIYMHLVLDSGGSASSHSILNKKKINKSDELYH